MKKKVNIISKDKEMLAIFIETMKEVAKDMNIKVTVERG
tara:strand:- start:3396 stop:3512 length:117 start_codon:yes stop_codon:yes gene_type:complete